MRIKAIKDIRSGLTFSSYRFTSIEFSVLQIRKILELIALSSLVSDYNVYELYYKNLPKMWNARLILKDIERINPKFYPQPTETIKREDGYDELVETSKEYLNKERFIEVYEKCGHILHSINSVIGEKEIDDLYTKYDSYVDIWLEWIENLLENHTIQLCNNKTFLYIVMGGEANEPSGNMCIVEGS